MNNPLTKYVPVDKQLHFAAGALVSLIVSALLSPLWGFVAAGVAGAGKEGYDWVMNKQNESAGQPNSHDVSMADYAATHLGGTAVALIMYAVARYF